MGGVLHKLLGLVNKNGLYYALDRTTIGAGPLWEVKVAEPGPSPDGGKGSISSSAWDESRLYVATGVTTVQGAHCAGSLRALNPTNGTLLWEDCLPGRVLGPVSAVPGVVVVGGGSHMYLVEATTGHIRFNFHDSKTNSMFWGPASISHGVLYEGNMDGILYAFGL
jgi:outer membrane protein assembly factor BamB